MHTSAKAIRTYLESNDLAGLLLLIKNDRKSISHLIRLAYNKDTLVGWRAILAIGALARELVKTDPEILRETCRKLLWSLSDESGGIGWSAPEILGEIVSSDTRRFGDIIPLIAQVFDIEERHFRPGVVYALLKVAEQKPDMVLSFHKIIVEALKDQEPLTKAYGLQLIAIIWKRACSSGDWGADVCDKVRQAIESLTTDKNEAWIYESDRFKPVSISELAHNVLKNKE